MAHLEGKARDTLRGFSLTDGHYETALEQLKERYNDVEQIIHSHYVLLSTTLELRRTFDYLEAQIRSLESLGESTDNNYIISVVKTKLPDDFNRRLEETRAEKRSGRLLHFARL